MTESLTLILSPTIRISHIKLEDPSTVKVRIAFTVSRATAVIRNMLVRPHKVLTIDLEDMNHISGITRNTLTTQ